MVGENGQPETPDWVPEPRTLTRDRRFAEWLDEDPEHIERGSN